MAKYKSKKKQKQEDEVLIDVEQKISNFEAYLEKNKTALMGFFIAIFVGIGGYFGFTMLYLQPLEKEAQYELYLAQEQLASENFETALEGDGSSMGFLGIAESFGMTKAANLSNYYAGIAYLNLGDYKSAIKYLDKFSTKDDILSVVAIGAIGDAFLELNQTKEGLEYYEKAVRKSKNNMVVPMYLMKAAQTAILLEDNSKALKHLNRLKKDYSESEEAQEAGKLIAMLENK
ncbi:MAG: tetratricopeptide repeat protein [Cryomorphaceae bacterium]|nr:tetratricopeptide repeat protein [Cryomorphaceae bacterium]